MLSIVGAASFTSWLSPHQMMPLYWILVIASVAVNFDGSLPFASALSAMSRSVTMPMSRLFSPTGIAPTFKFTKCDRHAGRNPFNALVHDLFDFHRGSLAKMIRYTCRV